jgi:predicted phage-related endonuclease
MIDFTPEIRNSGLWSTDSRRIAAGNTCAVVLEKLGRTEIENLDNVEVVQMGKTMQPVIARIFEDTHEMFLSEADYSLRHPKFPFIQSHFDYKARDHEFLVECKNYNAAYISHFSEPDEPVRVPDADLAQCLHEAIVHDVDTVYLAVLFGGQRYRDFKLTFDQATKDKWVEKLVSVWEMVLTNTPPDPVNSDQAHDLWPTDTSHSVIASKTMEALCTQLVRYQTQHKANEAAIDQMKTTLMAFMGDRSILQSLDGRTLATWKQAKGGKRFDAKLFQNAMPEVYNSFCVETTGSRRFLIKGES